MCFICDGGTYDELRRKTEADIDTFGLHIVAVERSSGGVGWAYSIGLLERFAHPELVVNGACCFGCAGARLNALGEAIAGGERFEAGDAHTPSDRRAPVARFGAVHPHHWQTSLFAAWLDHYDGRPWAPTPAALQVISRGQSGRWQDDPSNRWWRRLRLDRPPHLPGTRT